MLTVLASATFFGLARAYPLEVSLAVLVGGFALLPGVAYAYGSSWLTERLAARRERKYPADPNREE